MPLQISTLKFWINLKPLDYFHLIGMARGGRSPEREAILSQIQIERITSVTSTYNPGDMGWRE